jgi:Fur family transcriptional regulator, zinc uptake regulator
MNAILRNACEVHNVRATLVRKNLFDLLRAESPISVSSFFEITKTKGFDTVSVYRTLDLFRELDIMHEHGVGRQRILQARTEFDAHHHFISCEKCGTTREFEDDSIEFQLSNVAAENGFPRIMSHYLEIKGLCQTCYSATA